MTAQGGDLLAWMESAISDREETARAAMAFGDGFVGSETCVYGTGDGGPYLQVVVPGFDGQAEAATKHFALYGPEAVLRRCAADRKLLELHRPVVLHGGGGARYFEMTKVCKSCEPPVQFPETAYPCPTIVSLAEGYGWTAPQTPPIEGDQVT